MKLWKKDLNKIKRKQTYFNNITYFVSEQNIK